MSSKPQEISRGGREVVTLEEMRARIGAPAKPSEWVLVDQEMINRFADVTGDDAFIHVDPEAAAKTRFGGTVAHGLLGLSLMPKLMRSAVPLIRGTRMGANYGYEQVRFPASLPVGKRVRGWFKLADVEHKGADLYILHFDVSLEVEGQERPAVACHWLIARWMRAD